MNLANLLTYIKYDFKRTDKDTELTQAINDSILAIAIKMPHKNYKYQSWRAVVSGQEDYDLPSNIIHLMHPVRYLEGNDPGDSGYPLEHITKEQYDDEEPAPNRTTPDSTGTPTKYTVYSNSILLTPIPGDTEVSEGGLLEINWTKQPVDLTGSQTPDLEDSWREIIKWMTLDRVNAGIGLYDEAKYWESKYQDPISREPIGLYKSLLDLERDKESITIGKVETKSL